MIINHARICDGAPICRKVPTRWLVWTTGYVTGVCDGCAWRKIAWAAKFKFKYDEMTEDELIVVEIMER